MNVNNLSGYFKDQRWLVAHNAWNTNQNPGNNQSRDIAEMLDYGVRGLALDIYGDDEASMHLQHGHGNDSTRIDWSKILQELQTWLNNHPQEIITLFFESYLEGPKPNVIWNSPPALVALENSLDKITCYKKGRSVQETAMRTQTLNQLISQNHRLFAFIEHEPDEGDQDLFPVMTKTFTENVYGNDSLNVQKWANLREDSAGNNELTFMNHFGDSPVASRNDGNDAHGLFKQAYTFAFNYYGRYPNFISLDEINWTSQNDGPITVIRVLQGKKDVNIEPFQWVNKNGFDDLFFDMADSPITGFTVVNVPGDGIVMIRPERMPNQPAVTRIQLISADGYGIVNMRYEKANGAAVGWLLTQNEKDPDVNDKDITQGTYIIVNTLTGICCRTKSGQGVTDLATASAPRLANPPIKSPRVFR